MNRSDRGENESFPFRGRGAWSRFHTVSDSFTLHRLLYGSAQVWRDRRLLWRVYVAPRVIPASLRERVMVAVSRESGCSICETIHRNWATLACPMGSSVSHFGPTQPCPLSSEENEGAETDEMAALIRLIRFGNVCGNAYSQLGRKMGIWPFRLGKEDLALFLVLWGPVSLMRTFGLLLGVANSIRRVVRSSTTEATGEGVSPRFLTGEE